MPFSGTTPEHTESYWNQHFERFLKPIIEESGQFEAHRSTAVRGDLVRQIISDLVSSSVVVADLTDHNPNVFWELGIRQSFRHGTITIAERGTKLPFDLFSKGTLFYHPKDHVANAEFIRNLKKALKDCVDNPDFPDSPIIEAVAGRGTLYHLVRGQESLRRLDAAKVEAATNLEIVNVIYEQVATNRQLFKKRQMTALRLRLTSAELLIANRYLDADAVFYKTVENYHVLASLLNGRLTSWSENSKFVESWFRKEEQMIRQIMRKHFQLLSIEAEKLAKSIG